MIVGMEPSTPPALDSATLGARLREARHSRGWSQETLARRVVQVRHARGEAADAVSVKTQLSRWENNRVAPDRPSLTIIAEALDSTVEAVFGLPASPALPRPVLLEAHVTAHTVELLLAQRQVHARTEHSFGPAAARPLVAADLATVEGLLRATPRALVGEMHAVAALIAELGGWIAQESGHGDEALTLTCRAHHYAQGTGDPDIEAMVLMRWANIVTGADPRFAAELLDRATSKAPRRRRLRLRAAIARQQAHTASLVGDTDGFAQYAAEAAEHAQAPAGDSELAPYADSAYVASETAAGLLVLERPEEAAAILGEHLSEWVPGQERDHAVALCRWLQALTDAEDFQTALDQSEEVIADYRRAPSVRASQALAAIISRHRTRRVPAVIELRHRITQALQGAREP